MILEETINKLLRDVVDLILVIPGYTVKAKQEDTPRPTGSYADVDFVSDTSVGWEQREYENSGEDVQENIEGAREIMMSIGFYRDDAVDNSRKVRTAVIRESIQDLFRQAKLGLGIRSEVREISESFASGWEERSQFDIVLHAVGSDTDIINSIQSVEIDGSYESNGFIHNFKIEVP